MRLKLLLTKYFISYTMLKLHDGEVLFCTIEYSITKTNKKFITFSELGYSTIEIEGLYNEQQHKRM